MIRIVLRKPRLYLLATFIILFLSPTIRPQGVDQKPSIVRVEKTAHGIRYTVDSKGTADLLLELGQLEQRYGAKHTVIVYIDPKAPIAEIWNVKGVAAKAQLSDIRYFVLFPESQQTTELKWTPFKPFSENSKALNP